MVIFTPPAAFRPRGVWTFWRREKSRIYFFMFFAAPVLTMKVKVKVKFTLEQARKVQRGSRGITVLFLNLGARWVWWSTPRPSRFTPGRYPVPNCIGGWVGHRAGLYDAENLAPVTTYLSFRNALNLRFSMLELQGI